MLAVPGAESKGRAGSLGKLWQAWWLTVPPLVHPCPLLTLAFIAVCFRNKLQGEGLGLATLALRMGKR